MDVENQIFWSNKLDNAMKNDMAQLYVIILKFINLRKNQNKIVNKTKFYAKNCRDFHSTHYLL